MISNKMQDQLNQRSAIRECYGLATKLAEKVGRENVYDFTLGNPNVPAPASVNESIKKIVDTTDSVQLHGYMLNAGFPDVRETVADSINRRFGTNFNGSNIVMTVGAAGGMNVMFKVLLNPGDEVITFSPFFSEYRNYVTNYDGVLVEVLSDPKTFMPDVEALRAAINEKTKVLILNTPNNPTGVVYPESVIKEIADCLREESAKYGHEIIIISDEPYRELVYGDIEVPYITKYYDNTVVSYSYSKSLSLPGERIGYLVIPDELADSETVKTACGVATRIMGFVNAPAIMQKVVKENIDAEVDVEVYNKNRLALYNALTEYGFECVKPDGAFYLFMKTPTEDEREFTDKAREYNILVVPCSDFGGKGYVRIAYCVSYDTIERSLPAFKKLAEFYGLTK